MNKDIDLSFTPHPVTGDVSTRKGVSAVMQSLRNIVKTSENDVPFEPDGWGDLGDVLGENAHSLLALDIQNRVTEAIIAKETRIELVEVQATPFTNMHGYNVNIRFYMINVPVEEFLEIPIERVK